MTEALGKVGVWSNVGAETKLLRERRERGLPLSRRLAVGGAGIQNQRLSVCDGF